MGANALPVRANPHARPERDMAGGLDFDLPAVVPAGLIAYAVARGVPADALFPAIGLSPELLADPERPIPARVMLPLWRLLLERFPGEAIPLQLAEGMDFAYLGLAGQLIRHSPTVRVGVERTLRYQRLYDPGLVTSLTESDGRAIFTMRHVDEVHALGAPLVFMVAVSLNYFRQLVGERVGVVEAWLEGAPRADAAVYERYFGGPVRFGRRQTALILDGAVLDRPVIGADPNVGRYLGDYAEGLLAARPEPERPLAERVRGAIQRGLLEGDVRPDAIARRLATSTRSLQRHLAATGVSYRTLCDEVRRDTAMRLLADPGQTIHEVAFALGYGDTPSFYRAFKRWTGQTPAEARRDLRGG